MKRHQSLPEVGTTRVVDCKISDGEMGDCGGYHGGMEGFI